MLTVRTLQFLHMVKFRCTSALTMCLVCLLSPATSLDDMKLLVTFRGCAIFLSRSLSAISCLENFSFNPPGRQRTEWATFLCTTTPSAPPNRTEARKERLNWCPSLSHYLLWAAMQIIRCCAGDSCFTWPAAVFLHILCAFVLTP